MSQLTDNLPIELAAEAVFFLATGWEREQEWTYYTKRLNAIAGILRQYIDLKPEDVTLINNAKAQEFTLQELLKAGMR